MKKCSTINLSLLYIHIKMEEHGMKKMKRLVALLVCLATVASLCVFSIPVSAEEEIILNEYGLPMVEVTEADLLLIEKLEAMGAITNEYEPTTYVTRRQMADIIAKYIKLSVGNGATETPFNDVEVDDSSFPTIMALYDMGIISGDDQSNFCPDSYLTYDEALVFIINAIGHKMFAVRQGGFPTGYHRVAINHGMLKNLTMNNGSDPVSLIDLYRMLESAMSAAVVETSYNGDGTINYTLSKTETFLSNIYDIKRYRGTVTGNEYTGLTTSYSPITDEQIMIDGQIYGTPGYIYGYFLGYTVDYYLDHSAPDPEMIYIEEAPRMNEVISIDAEDIIPGMTTSDRIYYKDEELKEHHLEFASPAVIYNRQCWNGWAVLSDVIPATGYIEALDNNNDGIYDVIFVYEYENVVVGSVDSYNKTVTDKFDGTNVIDLHPKKHNVTIQFIDKNLKEDITAIMQNDVLSIVRSKGTEKVVTVYISREAVTGKIEGYDSEFGYLINGEYYEQAPGFVGTPLSVGLSGNFYTDMNGKIVTYRYDSASDQGVYGVVAGLDYEAGVLASEMTLKIFTTEGKFIEQPLANKVRVNNIRRDLSDSTDFNLVLSTLSRNSGGGYGVDTNYVIKYVTDGTEITSVDTGAVGGPGTLNVRDALGTDSLMVRGRYLLIHKDSTGNRTYNQYDSTNGIIFYVPAQGEIDREQNYRITKTLRTEDAGGQKHSGYALYSSNTTDIPKVDAILFWQDVQSVDADNSGMSVITDITTAVDQYGAPTKKIYFEDKTSVLVAPQVTFRDGTGTASGTADVSIDSLVTGMSPRLKPGVVIQYASDSDGLAVNISTVAKYESSTFTPLFFLDGRAYWGSNANLPAYASAGLLAGTIVTNDVGAELFDINIGGTSPQRRMVFAGAIQKAVMYIASEEKAVTIDVADIKAGDKFVIRVRNYSDVDEIIIFRD